MKPEAAMQIIGAIHNIQEHAYPLMSLEEGDAFDANLARLIDAVMTGYGPMSESSTVGMQPCRIVFGFDS